MSWFKRYPAWLHAEWQELLTNGNYQEALTLFGETFISCGRIVVRSNKLEHYPVLIVYPEGTPYQVPSVYLLNEVLDEQTLTRLSKRTPALIEQEVKPFIKFLYRRHQGPGGNLCFLETEDLHSEQAQFFSIREVIKRIRDWLAGFQTGRLPVDSPEVDLFSHFPHQHPKLTFLIPDPFFESSIRKGRFYFSRVTPPIFDEVQKVYIGVAFEGATEADIVLPLRDPDESFQFFGHYIPKKEDVIRRSAELQKLIGEERLIEGFWWDIDREPEPFGTVRELAEYLGEGERGFLALTEGLLGEKIKRDEDIVIGIRFPARPESQREFEWQFFLLYPAGGRSALIFPKETELIERLSQRKVEAIRGEYLDEQSFFKRNRGVFSRDTLKEKSVSLFGLGALGSELADSLAKAGVGHLHLVDMDTLKAQNTVRHLCGSRMLYFPKIIAVHIKILENVHHFVQVSMRAENIFQMSPEDFFPRSNATGLSTIASDNTEGYLNEMAVKAKRTVFYARALRGGKAARIFRVIPGIDACKACLSLYYQDKSSQFIGIEEDPDLPLIATECNNPIRPASAADLKLISSLTARVVLDFLEKEEKSYNHWIWTTEELPGVPASSELPFVLTRQFIPPHPDCPVCAEKIPVPILISKKAHGSILREIEKVSRVETGGILIGFESKKKEVVVLDASGPGPKAVMASTRFEKDIEYCQDQLAQASMRWGIRGLYLGEWHFHPLGSNSPSALDIRSLYEIAHQKNYATDQPIMIIAGPDKALVGTVHRIGSEHLPSEISILEDADAQKIEPLLHPE